MSASEVGSGLLDRVVLAILDEPPFCWLEPDGTAMGCDVEVAMIVLRRAGIPSVAVQPVTFAELIPGLVAGRWHLNTGMFITDARSRQVRFTRPIWAVPDGLIVRGDNVGRFATYRDLGVDSNARLGVVVGQVQGDSARQAGVPDERLVSFATQDDAVQAVRRGEIDAAASTAIGNRALIARMDAADLVAVDLSTPTDSGRQPVPVGAFSLSLEKAAFAAALDSQLAVFLGSPQHRAIVTRYGFTDHDVDALPVM
ncbi:transporter substrate-binding domain-containing protein [Virgisporangium aurantiacum]|uniref:Ectoine/hydroxyectoine ABC transporter substrate-binding protein EhuB n=1 Tax=Virgisporangium aurantiacum TaxID=175570 RepID=A0A8J3ZKT7_9ACTN|nr:transporter substrate-binding domain-containing protein [Virgisporangium aurantiacum]GIJ63795.1 ectoine/hydroxyectoine ABC transporter substrate-binding protein EhuB [Virgisporangium aurantiacum]